MVRESWICPACWRAKWSPIHWYVRLAGFCDGKNIYW